MRVEWVSPFIRATNHVLIQIASLDRPHVGGFSVEDGPFRTDEATAMLSVQGRLAGTVLFTMPGPTAELIVERMVGSALRMDDRLAESALGEMANMIAGYALGFLEGAGLRCAITSPVVLRGAGTVVSMTPSARLEVPLRFPGVEMRIAVCLHES